jgi:hypothetical protein
MKKSSELRKILETTRSPAETKQRVLRLAKRVTREDAKAAARKGKKP